MIEVIVRMGDQSKVIRRQKRPEIGTWILLKGRWWFVTGARWELTA